MARNQMQDMCREDPEQFPNIDWRPPFQVTQDDQVTDKLGRRLHYHSIHLDHGGNKKGAERKNAIRAEWTKLARCAKRGFYEPAAVELELTQGERKHVNRFLLFTRQTSSDHSQRRAVRPSRNSGGGDKSS